MESSNPGHPIWNTAVKDMVVQRYVEDTARICWKMAVQQPQMEFKKCDKWLGEEFQELHTDSINSPGAVVLQVYPMLYRGDILMSKGKVLMIDRSKLPQERKPCGYLSGLEPSHGGWSTY